MLTFIASALIWLLYMSLIILWFVDGRIKKEQVVHALVAGGIAFVATFILKHLIHSVRPYILNGMQTSVFLNPTDGAFPSAHTALAFSLAVTIFMHDKKVGALFLILALSIGTARVLANVHYPIDIIGGAFLGTFIAVLVEKTHFRKFVA